MRPMRLFCCSVAVAQQLYRQHCMSVIKKTFFHFYSLATGSISKRQVAKALHKPTQLLRYVPTQTCIDTLTKKLCATDFYVNNTKCIFLSKNIHTCTRFYFMSRYQINRFVRLGLSLHIHGNCGIRCSNAVCS